MDSLTSTETDHSEFVEVDPTGRYGRYDEVLGKGASKTVFRAFDEYQGIEVAWNRVKLHDFLQSPEELERLYCEIHLLKTLKHKNIMKFYTSWVDACNMNINFVTEMFTSGTLRQYRLKHKRVNIRAVKHWCRQILEGLLYLHSHDPPVIHRDLKCDNIFVNGNQGEVKIGDLGLAAILRKAHAVCCVGTPEFMAPEVYEEEYNELVDIYSFGMCILEMVTFEYPYSECTHAAQIYKKVVSGKKPEALYKVKDPEVREFVEKCLVAVSSRLPARELLKDRFLQIDDEYGFDLRPIDYYHHLDEIFPYLRQPLYNIHHEDASLNNGYINDVAHDPENNFDYHSFEYDRSYGSPFTSQGEHAEDVDLSIKGRRQEKDDIFLRLRIADREGRIRNIYFPFDIQADTSLSVANEMVAELDITDHDVTKIADMIDRELTTLVPEWKRNLSIEKSLDGKDASFCHNYTSYSSVVDNISSNSSGARNLQVLSSSKDECATVHGRFEEILYQVEGTEHNVTECEQDESNTSADIHYTDIWAQRERSDVTLNEFGENRSNEANETLEKPEFQEEERIIKKDDHHKERTRNSDRSSPLTAHDPLDDCENDIRQELRWLKAKYQIQLRELRDKQLGINPKPARSPGSSSSENKKIDFNLLHLVSEQPKEEDFNYRRINSENQLFSSVDKNEPNSADKSFTVKSFCAGALPPHPLHRATSLPVDAVDV